MVASINPTIKIGQLSLMGVCLISLASVFIFKGSYEAFGFFLMAGFLIFGFRVLEQMIFEHNVHNGYVRRR